MQIVQTEPTLAIKAGMSHICLDGKRWSSSAPSYHLLSPLKTVTMAPSSLLCRGRWQDDNIKAGDVLCDVGRPPNICWVFFPLLLQVCLLERQIDSNGTGLLVWLRALHWTSHGCEVDFQIWPDVRCTEKFRERT